MTEELFGKDLELNGRTLLVILSCHYLTDTEENTKILFQENLCPI
jgi:hypothetical protein